ncbi:MAG: alpha/beta hydrolase [Pseudomonadota bacterium]
MTKGYAETRDGQIHYRSAGATDAPAVLFLHQTASSGAMYEQVMARMADRRRCIAFDTPGFGGSFAPTEQPSLRYYAERLLEAADALGVETFDLCGHHTGGCIALEIAAIAGPRLRSLTLIGPIIASAAEREAYSRNFTTPFSIAADGSHLQRAWDYLVTIGAHHSVALHQREIIDHLIGAEAMPKAFSAVWRQNSEALLEAVAVPLLLMVSEDDALWPIFHNATKLRPDADVAIVRGMDFQPDADPQGVADALIRFIDQPAQA